MDTTSQAQAVSLSNRDTGISPSLEAALIDAVLQGDGRAFATLVQPHLPSLYRVAYRACGNSSLAEDAVQETLAIAHRSLKRYRPGTSFRSFLASIAVRRAHTLLRSEVRRARYEEEAQPPDSAPGADASLEAGETAARIRQILAGMPKKRRAAALLRLDAGLSYAEIARALGTSEGSARVHVHLALKTLRQELHELVPRDAPGNARNTRARGVAAT